MNRANSNVTTTLLARRARALKRHLKEAVRGSGKGVHRARVASRRLREAVPVLSTGIDETKAPRVQRKVRRVTRALGAIRELDVSIALLDELIRRGDVPRLALENVRAYVLEEQERRRTVMLKRLSRLDVDKLERRLGAMGEALGAERSDAWRKTLGSRLLKRSKMLRVAVDEAGQLYEAERLHKVRIAAKKLRYAAELAADSGIKPAAAPVRTIKRAQDTLGRLHDLQVLQSHVAAVQGSQNRQAADAALDALSRHIEEECRHLHAKYVAAIPDLQQAVDDIRRVVAPQLIRRARRPLKMKLAPSSSVATR